jgi:excisionase family DNA binding protein
MDHSSKTKLAHKASVSAPALLAASAAPKFESQFDAQALAVPKLAFRVDEAVFSGGISRSGIYRAIKDGRLHTVKVGGRRLIPRASLEAFLAGEAA